MLSSIRSLYNSGVEATNIIYRLEYEIVGGWKLLAPGNREMRYSGYVPIYEGWHSMDSETKLIQNFPFSTVYN